MINLLAIVVAAEEEAPPNPVIPVENEIVWAAIFFFALWAMMKFVLLRPILRAMEERSSTIQSGKDAADAATAALGSARRDHEATLAEARAEAEAIIADAREQATRLEADLIARAENDVAEAKERARIEVAAQRDQALADLRAAVAEQARLAADAVVRNNLDDATQSALIDDYISSVGAS